MRLITVFAIFSNLLTAFAVSAGPVRKAVSAYSSVGLIEGVCSGTLLRHGLFLTARHCFTHGVVGNLKKAAAKDQSIHVPNGNADVTAEDVVRAGNFSNIEVKFPIGARLERGNPDSYFSIKQADAHIELVLDEGVNDIAYLVFDPSATLGKVDIMDLDFALDESSLSGANQEILTVGFPLPIGGKEDTEDDLEKYSKNRYLDKIETSKCGFTGTKGYFSPKPKDEGYPGLLWETNCPSWYFGSGSAYFSLEATGKLRVLGVISHTFDVDYEGEFIRKDSDRDSCGPYGRNSIMSPLYEAKSLSKLLLEHPRLETK